MRFIDRYAVSLQNKEVGLTDVERVGFLRAVFDEPVFYVALMRSDVRDSVIARGVSNLKRLGRTANATQ